MPEWLRKPAAIAATFVFVIGCGISAQSPGPGGTSRPSGAVGTSSTTTSRPATSGPGASATGGIPGTPSATATTGAPSTPEGPLATPEGPLATPTGKLNWANWPAYMQFQPNRGGFRLVNLFREQTGIDVSYIEKINDNSEFFNEIQPDLAAGNYTGYDMITPSDWMVEQLIRLGYVEPLDYRLLPNVQANLSDVYRDPWYDPGNVYSVPWQAGIVGIGYNPKLTGREITKFDDLLDPAFAGNVGLFSEMIDTMCLTILSLGKECSEATNDDAVAAKDRILNAQNAGQQFQFFGNNYYPALAKGDIALTMAWSGDITQMKLNDNPDVEFVIPDTGGLLFVDNMMIPNGSQAYADAHMMIDFFYSLDVAVPHTEWVGYYSPVNGVPERVVADAQAARDAGDEATASYLEEIARTAVPTQEQLAQIHQYKILSEQDKATWDALFNEVVFRQGPG